MNLKYTGKRKNFFKQKKDKKYPGDSRQEEQTGGLRALDGMGWCLSPPRALSGGFVSPSSYNPFDGPNENPEAELPLTAGKYLYVYGDMDEDGFYEGQ